MSERLFQVYLWQGYRVQVAKRNSGDHWLGGLNSHKGARCPVCKRPFLLLLDINCADPRFKANFVGLKRLPLYYCWTCCADMYYRVSGPDRVRVVKHSGEHQRDDFPYLGFPDAFPRRPVRLLPIPKTVQQLIIVLQELDEDWLTPAQKRLTDRWMIETDLMHQFGGIPRLIQDHLESICPTPRCRRSGTRMQDLAVVYNDPKSGLPMCNSESEEWINYWVQVVFQICPDCMAIHAYNECD